MKIEYALNESVPFEQVELGGTFEHTGNVYMKMKTTYLSSEKGGISYNAINLNSAELVYLMSDMRVRPVRATLTIS